MVGSSAIALTGANQVVRTDGTLYYGFSLRETAGAVATVRIYDNASAASGTEIDSIELAANESAREFYVGGIWAVNGLYVSIVAGAVEGSVRIG